MMIIALTLVTLCSLWIGLGLFTVVRASRASSRPTDRAATDRPLPPLTILKPLCGAYPCLADNLRTFFEQDLDHYELVFGVESSEDPAIAVVRSLERAYPMVPSRLVIHGGGPSCNPKVRNLLGMIPHAQHDLCLISDSNIRVPSHYAREMVATFCVDPDVGLVTSLFAGTGENTLGSALENVQLNGYCAAGSTLPTTMGNASVVGKSMLLSQRHFASLGGLHRVADVLAEDYVMGKLIEHSGRRIRIAPTVLENVTTGMSLRTSFRRHLRWSMLRARLLAPVFLLEPLACPLVLLPLAWFALGPWALGWCVALLWLRDVGGWLALRGSERLWLPALLAPVRDLYALAFWLCTPFERYVSWNGQRVRVGAGTLLYGHATQRPSRRPAVS